MSFCLSFFLSVFPSFCLSFLLKLFTSAIKSECHYVTPYCLSSENSVRVDVLILCSSKQGEKRSRKFSFILLKEKKLQRGSVKVIGIDGSRQLDDLA